MTQKKKHISVVPYNPDWPKMFEAEATKIKEALGENCVAIHHIGSTSVPGLSAKPIIDIISAVRNVETVITSLEAAGYKHKGEYNIPMRLYFNDKDGQVRVNLHVYEDGNPEIELHILFKSYLRKHLEARDEYAQLKTDLLQQESSYVKANSMFTGYNLGKDAFIRKVLKETGFDGLRLLRCAHHIEWEEYHRIRNEQIFIPTNVIYDPNHPTITADSHFHFVLCKGVRVVSIAHVEFLDDKTAAIRSLATDEPYKNQGFGTHMMALLEKWIKHQDRGVIKIHAALRAERFYRKLGYIEMEFNDQSISEEIIDLGKVL